MKVLQIGAKNFPPAHGGTETVVYHIVQSLRDIVDFKILVEWKQDLVENVESIPENLSYLNKMYFILKYARKNEIDIIHFHNEKYIPMAIVLSMVFKRIVLTVHGVHFRSPKWNYFTRSVFWIVDVLGSFFVKRLVHCSEYDKKTFEKITFFRQTYYVNNGTVLAKQPQKIGEIIHEDTYVFLGRITPAKNVIKLVQAATKQKIKVDIFGRLDKECKSYVDEFLSIVSMSEYVFYKGEIRHEDVFNKMKEYKAFLYITIMEGLPLAVLEAASCGLPLILSEIPHHTYLRFPNVHYVEHNNPILPLPENIVGGIENRDHVQKYFSVEQMGENYLKIYKSIIQ